MRSAVAISIVALLAVAAGTGCAGTRESLDAVVQESQGEPVQYNIPENRPIDDYCVTTSSNFAYPFDAAAKEMYDVANRSWAGRAVFLPLPDEDGDPVVGTLVYYLVEDIDKDGNVQRYSKGDGLIKRKRKINDLTSIREDLLIEAKKHKPHYNNIDIHIESLSLI